MAFSIDSHDFDRFRTILFGWTSIFTRFLQMRIIRICTIISKYSSLCSHTVSNKRCLAILDRLNWKVNLIFDETITGSGNQFIISGLPDEEN